MIYVFLQAVFLDLFCVAEPKCKSCSDLCVL